MKLRPDTRGFPNDTDRHGSCRKCGCRLILLPMDRRNGYCFECYDPFLTEESGFEAA